MRYRIEFFMEPDMPGSETPDLTGRSFHRHAGAVASWIYNILSGSSQEYAKKLHDKGLQVGEAGKIVKPFTFSRLFIDEKTRICSLKISSIDPEFLYHFTQGIRGSLPKLQIADTVFLPTRVQHVETPAFYGNGIKTANLYTLSPVVLKNHKNRYLIINRETLKESEEILKANTYDKHLAIFGRAPVDDRFSLLLETDSPGMRPVNVEFKDSRGNVSTIVGNIGKVMLRGSVEMLTVAVETGLGAKNGIGFGFVEKHRMRRFA